MLKLKWPASPSPFWLYSGRVVHHGRVQANGTVYAESDTLDLLEGEMPKTGTILKIRRTDAFLVAETESEYQEREARETEQRRADALLRQQELARAHAERQLNAQQRAAIRNAALNIPVRWTSGLKTVLSGLSAASNGSGDNARSVSHILLLEPLTEGRFQRRAQSFLCTSAGGSNGQAWTDRLDTHSTGPHGPYVSEITCKQCLKLAQRWAGAAHRVEPELTK